MKALALILTFSIIIASSHATPTLVIQPQINQSPILYYAQENVNKNCIQMNTLCIQISYIFTF